MNLIEFQQIWANPPATLTERAGAQSHFNDLCALFAQPKPTDDPSADFTFEHRVREIKGGKGFVDAWKRGAFAWEYKRPGGDLDKAYGVLSLSGFSCPLCRPYNWISCATGGSQHSPFLTLRVLHRAVIGEPN